MPAAAGHGQGVDQGISELAERVGTGQWRTGGSRRFAGGAGVLLAAVATAGRMLGAAGQQRALLRALSEMCRLQGVGALTALVFLTEVGDPRRFHNRRQIAAYLGLIPASHESGSRSDCKGHITRQGPSRVRRVLCQATWTRTRFENADQAAYQRVVQRNPKHKKIAVVATMRRLAIQIWHAAVRGVEAAEDATSHDRGRNQRPQVPPPDPHLLPSLRSQ